MINRTGGEECTHKRAKPSRDRCLAGFGLWTPQWPGLHSSPKTRRGGGFGCNLCSEALNTQTSSPTGHIHGTLTRGTAQGVSESIRDPPKVPPESFLKDCRGCNRSESAEETALGFPAGLSYINPFTLMGFCAFVGPPGAAGEDQQNITEIHGVVIFSVFCPCHSPSVPSLFSISIFSLSYLLSKPRLLSLHMVSFAA